MLLSQLTCSQQTDRVRCLCQEVGITEHVLLVDDEAQEGEGGVVDVEHKLLLHPHRIQTVISWEGQKEGETLRRSRRTKKKKTAEGSQQRRLTHDVRLALAVVVIGSTDFHLHERTNDAPAVLGQVASPQHLKKPEHLFFFF